MQTSLTINDRIYGSHSITEPVLIELIHSRPMQRLKRIEQHGVPAKYHIADSYSRYEHSVGVMLLLRRLNASLEEQVAGLLHDVSHTTFSHVIDWLYGTGHLEDHQDRHHASYIESSEIPTILKKYEYNSVKIANLHGYTLLDADIPNLCADRIDYTLRELSQDEIQDTLAHLAVHDNKIIMNDEKSALRFARAFLSRQIAHLGRV